jgi:hypothetical protein
MNFSGRGHDGGYDCGYDRPCQVYGYTPYGYVPVAAPVAARAVSTARQVTLLAGKNTGT